MPWQRAAWVVQNGRQWYNRVLRWFDRPHFPPIGECTPGRSGEALDWDEPWSSGHVKNEDNSWLARCAESNGDHDNVEGWPVLVKLETTSSTDRSMCYYTIVATACCCCCWHQKTAKSFVRCQGTCGALATGSREDCQDSGSSHLMAVFITSAPLYTWQRVRRTAICRSTCIYIYIYTYGRLLQTGICRQGRQYPLTPTLWGWIHYPTQMNLDSFFSYRTFWYLTPLWEQLVIEVKFDFREWVIAVYRCENGKRAKDFGNGS